MKLKNLFLIGIVVITALCSCGGSELKSAIDEVNDECPITLSGKNEITSVQYDNANVIFNFTFDEEETDIQALKNIPDALHDIMLAALEDKNFQELVNDMKDEGAGFVANFKGNKTGETATAKLTPAEIADIANGKKAGNDPLTKLKSTVAVANETLPEPLGDDMTMTRVSVDNGNVVYTVSVKEPDNSISELEASKAEMRKGIKESFMTQDKESKDIIKDCIQAKTGIAFRFFGSKSGKSFTIEIPYTELGTK